MNKEDVFRELQVEDWSEEEKNELIDNINDVTEMRFVGLVDDIMTDQQKIEFSKINQDEIDVVGKWLIDNIPQAKELYISTMEDYIMELKVKFAENKAKVEAAFK